MAMMDSSDTRADDDLLRWTVVDRMFADRSVLVQHQFESFNAFVSQRLEHVIQSFNPIEVNHAYDPGRRAHDHQVSVDMTNMRFAQVKLEEPDGTEVTVTPAIARMRQMSYVTNLVVDLQCTFRTFNADAEGYHTDTKSINNVFLGKIPLMVRSKYCVTSEMPLARGAECEFDYGGYFIIQGTEKVVVSQDRLAENKVQVFLNTKATPYLVIAEVRSILLDGVVPKTTVLKISNKEASCGHAIKATVHHVKADVPVCVLFKAFGVESDAEIVEMVCRRCRSKEAREKIESLMEASVRECVAIQGKDQALAFLAQHLNVSGYHRDQLMDQDVRVDILRKLLATECLPHVGACFGRKADFLAGMTHKMLSCFAGIRPYDDRDSYVNKKVDCAGQLLTTLTKQYMSKMIKDFRNCMQKEINSGGGFRGGKAPLSSVLTRVNVYKMLKPATLTQGLSYAMSTGNWHMKQSVKIKSGVAQVLNRMNYLSTLSHMRRVNTTIEKSGRLVQPRKVHSTNFGIICPCECFDPSTPVLTWEGTVKPARDVAVGDLLIDDLGNAVRVRSTCSGVKQMYEVVPDDRDGFASHTVTDNHILTLASTREVVDIAIEAYLSLPAADRESLLLFKPEGINWERKRVAVDPYVLGTWLGYSWGDVGNDRGRIPLDYIVNDRPTRLAVLAGLVDACGKVVDGGLEVRIAFRVDVLLRDARFLAMSLGFKCRTEPSRLLCITGLDLHEIPTTMPGKKMAAGPLPFRTHTSSFRLVRKDVQPFVGWQLEGSGRFLLGDMTVVHNTPEGASVGLVKNLAMSACVTCASNPAPVLQLLRSLEGSVAVDEAVPGASLARVVVNGDTACLTRDPAGAAESLRAAKRRGSVNVFTSVVTSVYGDVHVNTEAGRCVRPLLIVDPQEGLVLRKHAAVVKDPAATWMDLVTGSERLGLPPCVEYMDCEEQNAALIAMHPWDLDSHTAAPRYTHCEVHPCMMLGVAASCIPFCDHNQSPRNCYQSSMCKQAIGVHASNHHDRFDALAHVLVEPQRPIVRTRMASILNDDKLPSGVNALVAIACFHGYNQEDAVILNRSSVERGMFHTVCYKSHRETNMKNHSSGQEEVFCNAGNIENRPFNYDKLGPDGFVPPGTFVQAGDIIIGKVLPNKHMATPKDASVALKSNDCGYVDRQITNIINGDGYTSAKVRIRNNRPPVVGDKFASRHAQKGTVGVMYHSWDMPFTEDGITPDIIINPNCIPSRMTIGQILEMVMGKAACAMGVYGDATPFNPAFGVDDLMRDLERCGMERHGDETMYNPVTGEKIRTKIFMGVCYYQRLKHMTCDKVHSRGNNGPVVMLTRQPSDGRSRAGGLRVGTMEVECLWSHGCAGFVKERIMECSDNFAVAVCEDCGAIGEAHLAHKHFFCRACNNRTRYSEVRMPYACKLFLQELGAMSIGARINKVLT